ncbi:MAG: hypothetical protein HY049_07960 [Acidobacteria bacterium]|nr:hypothetical protein [Acidobacteriota bacterium]
MQALSLSLVLVAGLLTIQRMMLRGQWKSARLKMQAYRFHAIRDTLQLYAVEGLIDQASDTYGFVMGLANLSIRNAGSMKFSALVTTAAELGKTVEQKVTLFDDIRRHDEKVRRLTGECFTSFGRLLITHDPVVRLVVASRVRVSDRIAEALAGHSTRATAVRAARKYIGWGRDLATA